MKRARKPHRSAAAAAQTAAADRGVGPNRAGNVMKLNGPTERVGTPAHGRIIRLLVGQSYGFIRGPRGREVFFHRADVGDATAFNALSVGDIVEFQLIDDAVSGARAIGVKRRGAAR
jgi:cold shock CspA family protein